MDGVLGSAYRCIRTIVPFMNIGGGGSIVNVASMYGVTVPDFGVYDDYPEYINPPHYGAGKAGLIHMTRYFARLLGASGIRVNAVSPGAFPNGQIQADEQFIDNLAAKTALGRIGHPQDLVGAFVFLCSAASSYVTGHNLVVDGGWVAGA
jgi:gluconate 5-dehydrogenase